MSDLIPKGAVLFSVACPEITSELSEALKRNNRFDIAAEFDSLYVVSRVSGPPDNISFGAYSIPGLSYEERQAMALKEWERVQVPVRAGAITFALDDFGKINQMFVKDVPEVYGALRDRGYTTDEDLASGKRPNRNT